MKLGIGIDTGGTYTDSVIYDFESKTILGSAKSLTTREDLTIGILGAIDGLPLDLVRQTEVISLSTTLATNACVENKGGRAKLIFFGGEKDTIDQHGQKFGLPLPMKYIYRKAIPIFRAAPTGSRTGTSLRKHLTKALNIWTVWASSK